MGYPTQGHIAKDVEQIKKILNECETKIDRVKQLAVKNGELLKEILKIIERG